MFAARIRVPAASGAPGGQAPDRAPGGHRHEGRGLDRAVGGLQDAQPGAAALGEDAETHRGAVRSGGSAGRVRRVIAIAAGLPGTRSVPGRGRRCVRAAVRGKPGARSGGGAFARRTPRPAARRPGRSLRSLPIAGVSAPGTRPVFMARSAGPPDRSGSSGKTKRSGARATPHRVRAAVRGKPGARSGGGGFARRTPRPAARSPGRSFRWSPVAGVPAPRKPGGAAGRVRRVIRIAAGLRGRRSVRGRGRRRSGCGRRCGGSPGRGAAAGRSP